VPSRTSRDRRTIDNQKKKNEQFTEEKERAQEGAQEEKRQGGERCAAGGRSDHVQHTNSRFDRKTRQVLRVLYVLHVRCKVNVGDHIQKIKKRKPYPLSDSKDYGDASDVLFFTSRLLRKHRNYSEDFYYLPVI